MTVFDTNHRQQRLKSEKKWRKSFRNPRLLRFILFLGLIAFRLWRWLCRLIDMFGG